MCTHGILCYLAFFLGPLLWRSFVLHTVYLLLLVLSAVYNGATFYFRVFSKRYYKTLLELELKREEEEEERQHRLSDGNNEKTSEPLENIELGDGTVA
jgi:hypothetical protein